MGNSGTPGRSGTLFVVATPLGNVGDLSERALDTLRSVDLVAAEDTRRTGRLLRHLGVDTPLKSLHEHSDAARIDLLVGELAEGRDLALVSDAGTPLISDPGFELVRAARAAGIGIVPVPGPSAVTAALSVAGLPTDRFLFAGFPPARQAARRESFGELASQPATVVWFESCHRVVASVADLMTAAGSQRPVFVGREMTKLHEQYWSGTLQQLAAALADGTVPVRGEFVLVLAGVPAADDAAAEQEAIRLLRVLCGELPVSRAAKVTARLTGLDRARCYALAEALPDRS